MPVLASVLAALFVLVASSARAAEPERLTLSIVGTSDLHGHVAALPWFAGYLRNLRAAREAGAVILLDAGDMFQGTLESNLFEGAPVVEAYNVLGYNAAAIGNHEFDFGPSGPAPSPTRPDDDAQGALKARAAQAHFPFLAANLVRRGSHKPLAWPNVQPLHALARRRNQGRHRGAADHQHGALDLSGQFRRSRCSAAGDQPDTPGAAPAGRAGPRW